MNGGPLRLQHKDVAMIPSAKIRKLFFTAAPALLALFTSSRNAAADPARVEVEKLDDRSELELRDVAVLDDLILTTLSELPRERFVVSAAAPRAADAACDEACRADGCAGRGVLYLVMGSVSAFGDGTVATLKLLDSSKTQVVASETTGAQGDPAALLTEVRSAAARLRQALLATSTPAPPPSVATIPQPNAAATTPEAGATTAVLRVETTPPGAKIYVKRVGHTEYIGAAPVEKILLPVEWDVHAELEGYRSAAAEIRLDPLEKETVRLSLHRVYPTRIWGHLTFWSGLVVVGGGFLALRNARWEGDFYNDTGYQSARDASRRNAGAMWACFGIGTALVTTGIALFAKTAKIKKAHAGARVGLGPTPDGLALAYGGWF
jgi:hypothetical protein